MASSAIGNDDKFETLDAIDQAVHARFMAAAGNVADFLWPDAELNARLGRKKQQAARDARRKDNERRLERLAADAAVASPPQAQSSSPAVAAFTWADGVRERELRGHEARVVTLSIDGTLLASTDADKVVKIWDLRSAECVRTLQLEAGAGMALLQGAVLAVGMQGGGLQLWHARTGEQLCELSRGYIGWTRWCGPSQLMILACDEVPVGGSGIRAQPELWSVESGEFQLLTSATTPNDQTMHCLAADSRLFVHGGHKAMHVWSLPELTHMHKLTLPQSGSVMGALKLPDATCMDLACSNGIIAAISSSGDTELQLWDAVNGSCTRRIQSFGASLLCAPSSGALNIPGHTRVRVVGKRFVYVEWDRTSSPLRILDVASGTAACEHTINPRLAWRTNGIEVGEHAIATTTLEPRANGHTPAHGEDHSHCIKLLRPAPRGTSHRTFNERDRPWDADQQALATELQRLGLQRFATNKFLQALEDRGFCSIENLRGICVAEPLERGWHFPDGRDVSIRDPQEHAFLGLTAEEAKCLADGITADAADSSRAERMQDRRHRLHAQAAAGNADANELMDRDAIRHRVSRKRTAEDAEAGDEGAQLRRAAELERIETRLPEHSAASRRERRARVSQRASADVGSAVMRDAAETQRANERDRGRQRRER